MRSVSEDIDLAERIKKMREAGLPVAIQQGLLPSLYKELYGRALKRCGGCYEDAFEQMGKWVDSKLNSSFGENKNMATHKLKPEHLTKEIVLRVNGQARVISQKNLTQENVDILLANNYAHLLMPNEAYEQATEEAKNEETFVVAVPPKVAPLVANDALKPEVKEPETQKEESPNVSEAASVSTSKGQQTDGRQWQKNKGKHGKK